MTADLTDVEAARLVRKHPRTIQRWCQQGKLPGSYKAGRSWRIPTDALTRAGLDKALEPDKLESQLTSAEAVVAQLLAELDDSARRKQPPVTARDWGSIAATARRLNSISRRLAARAADLHQRS